MTTGPDQLHLQPRAPVVEIVAQERRSRALRNPRVAGIVIDDQIEITIVVEIPSRHAPGIQRVVDADGPAAVRKARASRLVEAFVAKQYIILVAIPGDLATELVRVKQALLVLLDVRDRAQDIRQS